MKTVFAIACSAVGFFLGVISSSILIHWPSVRPDFFNITLVQCLQLFVTVFVGSMLSLWVHLLTSRKARCTIICDDLIDSIQAKQTEAYDVIIEYMRSPAKVKQKAVTMTLKALSCRISLLDGLCRKRPDICRTETVQIMKETYQRFKSTVTGGTFGSVNNKYKPDQFGAIDVAYQQMLDTLLDARLNLHI